MARGENSPAAVTALLREWRAGDALLERRKVG